MSAGDRLALARTPLGNIGMTVCYDVRFPQLYRALAKAGAEILTVPAAFTQVTGEAHWHVLLRARAIETGCFVIAPAQTGMHPGDRKTFGHSLIIDPWGRVLADGGIEPGIIMAEIDIGEVKKVRARLPSLSHDREYGPSDD
jgi:predicted amidohydrolase